MHMNDLDAKRAISFGAFSDNLTSDFNGATSQVFAEAAYSIDFAGGVFEPYLGLAQVHAETDSFAETGSTAALSAGDSDMNVTYLDLGLRASKTFAMGERNASVQRPDWLAPRLRRHHPEHGHGDCRQRTVLPSRGRRSTRTRPSSMPVSNFNLAENANLYINYVGQFADGGSENGVNAGLEIRF